MTEEDFKTYVGAEICIIDQNCPMCLDRTVFSFRDDDTVTSFSGSTVTASTSRASNSFSE